MNIYLLVEDGESFCIRADIMFLAVNICETSYLDDRMEEEPTANIDSERLYYHAEILQSCSMIGPLRN